MICEAQGSVICLGLSNKEALTQGGRKRISDTCKVLQVGTATSDSPEDALEDTES